MHDWKKMMNPSYPEDLYDTEDYYIEIRRSDLTRAKLSHFIMGLGFGVMLTVALSGVILWINGV